MNMKLSMRSALSGGTKWMLLMVCIVWSAFPILFIVTSSFKRPSDIWAYPPKLISEYSLENYSQITAFSPNFYHDLWNSVQVTLLGVICTIIVSVAAAFVFSRLKAGWLKAPGLLIISIRMFPPIIVIIPLYPVMNALGVLDTFTPIVLAGVAFEVSIATLLLKAFIDDIPVELEEAAMIDGCTQLQAFFRITLPLIAPGIGAVVVFVAVSFWNDYLFPLVFTSTDARTAPITIAANVGNPDGVAWGQLLAMSSMHLAPMVLLVMLIHKQLIKGMTMGAVKG